MRGLWIGLALALASGAASAQTPQQRDWCFSPTATDDQWIEGCTAVIQSGRETTVNQAAAYDNRGSAYDNKGLYDQAIADGTQSLGLNPNSANAYNLRGYSYDDKGLYDQAIADYTRAIALKPDRADATLMRGLAYEKKGLRDPAIADYRAALKIKPSLQAARIALTRLGATP
jgi:tetratricopeptide (TPR) repeat protein